MPLTRGQILRRRRFVVFGSLGLLLAVIAYLPLTLLAPLRSAEPALVKHAVLPGAAAQLTFPTYGGSAIGAVGYDGVLAQAGSTAALPMASITKIVTTLVVLQAKPLAVGQEGPSITMTAADVALYRHYLSLNGSVKGVRAGLVFSEHELLELTLVPSADNYAASLAVWAYGSMDAYLAAAKSWVAANKLTSIVITDPSGIEPTDVSNTADLIQLGKLALANPVLSAVVSTKAVTVHDVGALTNTNSLLGTRGVDGIKTGTLNGAGSNLLFSADYAIGGTTVTVIGVVLGGANHTLIDADIRTLLDATKAGFHQVTLTTKGQVLATYTTDWDQRVSAVAQKSTKVLTWSDTAVNSSVTAEPVTTGSRGTVVGSVVFTVGTTTVTVPIELSGALTDPGPGWRLSHPGLIVGAP